jgi:UDP-glucuronate 4-epimerase
MHVLITGSSGLIGTNLSLALMERGHSVEGIDIRPNTWTRQIQETIVDLRELARAASTIGPKKEPDVVVHLAAHAKVFQLVQEPQRAWENVMVFRPVLEYARQNRIPLVLASSREVYGDLRQRVTSEDDVDIVVSHSPYSSSKLACEAFLYSYSLCYALPFVVFRFSNVYGRYDSDLERLERVVPLFIRNISEGRQITVFGPSKTLDFTYVDDCIRGCIAGIEKVVSGEIRKATINLASGQGHSLDALVNLIAVALGSEPKVERLNPRSGEITHYVADISKARALLGYEPQTHLPAGLLKAIAWQRETCAIS